MKILIADDEKMVRISLKSMLMDMDLPLEIVGEAKNGEEFVNMLETFTPDIAFVDIKMPKLNGLEAIKIGKTVSPHTQWVILTGFSQFDYAQEAIRLGASNYLLKPVSPEELEETLKILIKQNKEYQITLNKKFERDIISLYYDIDFLQEKDAEHIILKSKLMGAVFCIDSSLNENCKAERQRKFFYALRSIIDSLLVNDIKIALFNLSNGDLATVCAWNFIQENECKQLINSYFEKVVHLVNQLNDSQFSITVLQTDEFSHYKSFYEQLYQIQKLAPLRVMLGIGIKWTIQDLILNEKDPTKLRLSTLLINLCEYYNENMYLHYEKVLKELKSLMLDFKCINNSKVKKAISGFLFCSMNCKLEINQDMNSWINTLDKYGEHLLVQNKTEKISQSDLVSQVISFIDQNYMYDIGIGPIAEKLNITPNYLSSLFHKKTGMKFIDYLTEVRILNAKKMLTDNPQMQVKQVAKEVGYYSTRHFTKLFVKFVGCYPSEYQKNFNNKRAE
jgi:two-component system response regulator YesN